MTGTIVDMHCHTTNGASDSALTPAELAAALVTLVAEDRGLERGRAALVRR